MATINDYDSQFTYVDDDSLPDLFGDRDAVMEDINVDAYDDFDEDLTDDEVLQPTIFEQGQFDNYSKYCDFSEFEEETDTQEPAEESIDDFAFGFDLFNDDYDVATEAMDDDLAALGDIDGSNEENEDIENDTPADDDTPDDTENTDDNNDDEDDTPDDLAAATDAQLEEDNQSPEDEMNGEEDAGDMPTEDTDTSSTNISEDDPLKSIASKSVFRDKLIILYNAINDSIDAMEDFTPDFNTEASKRYYTIRRDLNLLKDSIYTLCVKKMNIMPVDEVLRKYTECNLAYDSIIRDAHTFSDEYGREIRAKEAKEKKRITGLGKSVKHKSEPNK